MRTPRFYFLACAPFIAVFAYQVLVAMPQRPAVPDPVHGYTIRISLDEEDARVRYLSALDCAATFGPLLCAALIMAAGAWRGGAPRRRM
jgi:hypothetical protein